MIPPAPESQHVDPCDGKLFCGVDVGAAATKLVILDGHGRVLARAVQPSGVNYGDTARDCLVRARADGGVADRSLDRTVATGYGRKNVDFADDTVTEILCHGLGGFHHFNCAITVVDIGGQDNKVIRLESDGRRADFKMNRKCAAGTGAFIEEIALRLGVRIEQMEQLASQTDKVVKLSSFCTVFAKTEILAHLRQGVPVEQIVRGAFVSVINRVMEMVPLEGDIVLTGGVVEHNPSIAEILARMLGRKVEVPPHPQHVGALGAALVAKRQHFQA